MGGFAFLVTRVGSICLLVRLIIFNFDPTNHSVQETSLSKWWVSEYNMNEYAVTTVIILIVVGILTSNVTVFFALNHMKYKGEKSEKSSEVSETNATESC